MTYDTSDESSAKVPSPTGAHKLPILTPKTVPPGLCAQASQGHEAVFFVDIYTPLVQGWLRRHFVEFQDAEDLTQEVLGVVVRQIKHFDHNQMSAPWIRRLRSKPQRLPQSLRRGDEPPRQLSFSAVAALAGAVACRHTLVERRIRRPTLPRQRMRTVIVRTAVAGEAIGHKPQPLGAQAADPLGGTTLPIGTGPGRGSCPRAAAHTSGPNSRHNIAGKPFFILTLPCGGREAPSAERLNPTTYRCCRRYRLQRP
jgi:hypothetical protein